METFTNPLNHKKCKDISDKLCLVYNPKIQQTYFDFKCLLILKLNCTVITIISCPYYGSINISPNSYFLWVTSAIHTVQSRFSDTFGLRKNCH